MPSGGTWTAGALAAALLAAGCGGGKSAQKASTCGPVEGAATSARSSAAPEPIFLLTDVRPAAEKCVDRISFDFRPDRMAAPGYHVEYRPAGEAQVEDASGRHIDVDGSAFLVVRLAPAATANLSGSKLKFTYTGPRRLRPERTRFVREVVKTGDFESVVTWAIGLREERPFRVETSKSPPRLTVVVG